MADVRTWSPQQADALAAVHRWYNSGLDRKQVFRVFGYAGTGKTQTRRVLKAQHDRIYKLRDGWYVDDGGMIERPLHIPYAIGDRLYVREAWRTESRAYDDLSPSAMGGEETIIFEVDADWKLNRTVGRLRQGMHMPCWASRITLIVSDVRVQRLQDISEADAIAEGLSHIDICGWGIPGQIDSFASHATTAYRYLWDRLNYDRGYGWDANPWVAAYSFRPILGNIDQVPR